MARRIERLTDLLAREVAIQRALSHGSRGEYSPARREVAPADVVDELQNVFSNHAAARGKSLLLPAGPGDAGAHGLPPADARAHEHARQRL